MNIRWILAAAIATAFAAGCGGGIADSPLVTAKRSSFAGARGIIEPDRKLDGNPRETTGVGTFRGAILFNGPVPRAAGFDVTKTKDKFCIANARIIKDKSLIVDSETRGLKNAIVYLLRKPAGYNSPAPVTAVRFSNRNCMFEPRILTLRVGQPVIISNDDATAHNALISHLNPLTTAFSQTIAPQSSATHVYGGPEVVPVKVVCNLHPWMLAWHLPLDHEFFAVTDAKGEFEIKRLPAGTHQFRIWHERPGYLENRISITIKAGGTVRRTFKYAPSKFASFHGPAPKSVVVSLSKTSVRRFDP
jgi:plastocyanin